MSDIYVSPTGSDTTGTGASGSPYATPGKAAGVMSGGDRILVQGPGTYTMTVNTVNVAGGIVGLPAGVVGTGMSQIVGYNLTPGDLDEVSASSTLHPVIQGYSGSTALMQTGGSFCAFRNLVLDGVNHVSSNLNLAGSFAHVQNIKSINAVTDSFRFAGSSSAAIRCLSRGGSYGFDIRAISLNFISCVSDGASLGGFYTNTTGATCGFERCIARLGTGSAPGFYLNNNVELMNCVSYKNAGDGVGLEGTALANLIIRNTIIYGNGPSAWGINQGSATIYLPFAFDYNAYGSNTSGNYSNASFAGPKDITGISDPFVNGSATITSLDDAWAAFALSSGGKTALAGKGYPTNLDIGAVQSAAGGGGSGGLFTNSFSGGML